jgi:hypothetical protein
MIEVYEPSDWRDAESIQVDSDAPDNMSAILEIDDWAAANDFVRESSYWLRPIHRKRDGKRVFRVVLFRLSPEELETRQAENDRVAASIATMPATEHRVR